jgi:fatty-acyl-CoA synthase
VIHWDCTMFQYIGELCRYLLHAAPSENENGHRIRMACGNGLAPEVWDRFKERFSIPQIFEFYAATEGGVSLFNIEGKRGAIGHIPPYLTHRFSPALVSFDVETGEPIRNAQGFCVRCSANEPGEAIGKSVDDPSNIGSRFEGYTNHEASERRILRNVFAPGDVWVRTGDLMRKDEQGYFYFVDRIGDTFRWKGENVAASEVAEAIADCPGILDASVYGVAIAGADGRAGMAAIVTDERFDLIDLQNHLAARLPAYAQPAFIRICPALDITETFKQKKQQLVREGFDPRVVRDPLFFRNAGSGNYGKIDAGVHAGILDGTIRL